VCGGDIAKKMDLEGEKWTLDNKLGCLGNICIRMDFEL